MKSKRMTIRLAILFLLLGTAMAWSKRTHKPRPTQLAAAESKVNPQYTAEPKASASSYILDEDHYHPKEHGKSESYLDSEDHKSINEHDEGQGNENSDHTTKNDEYDEHSEKGGFKEFKAGGLSYDKHLKDHKADNKEIENVKQHDVGEKFGGEMTKEHKLGKHKEKSKGHKLHGFKNVYHKEEYGDHKTFHDEFLDSDHQHNYDEDHEHQEMHGGKFSKGYKHEGKEDKQDKGNEKHEWAKEEFDGHHEGNLDKGGHKSKQRHATKKHQGHYDANSQRQKNAVHKVKKGVPPSYVHHGSHHGPHQAQIQPYVPHHTIHHEPVHVPSHSYKPPSDHLSHDVAYDDDKHYNNGDSGNHYSSHGTHSSDNGGHHISDLSDDHYPKDDAHDGDDYHERTAHNPQHRSSIKESSEEKNEDKFIPAIKHQPVAHKHQPSTRTHEPIIRSHGSHKHEHYPKKHEPMQKHEPYGHTHELPKQKHEPYRQAHELSKHKHEPYGHTHELSKHKHEPYGHTHELSKHKHEPYRSTHELSKFKHEPYARTHGSSLQKQELHAHKHQPHPHNHHSHGFKQSVSPNFGTHQYPRQAVYQENSQVRPPQPLVQDKFAIPFNERFNNHNHRIRYGFQPRSHHQQQQHSNNHKHNHNHQSHNNFNSHHQHQPFPRFSQQIQANPQSHGHHHHNNAHKNHNHYSHQPSNYQPEPNTGSVAPKAEYIPSKPTRSEDAAHRRISQRHYE